MNSPVKILTKLSVGENTWLFLECEQKRDQARSEALEIYFRKYCRMSNTRNFILDFLLNQFCLLPLNGYFCAKTKRNVNVWGSLPYPTEFSQNGNLSVVEKSSHHRAQFIVKSRA